MMLAGLAIGPSIAVLLKDNFGIGAVGIFASAMLVVGGSVFILALLAASRANFARMA